MRRGWIKGRTYVRTYRLLSPAMHTYTVTDLRCGIDELSCHMWYGCSKLTPDLDALC